MEISYVYIMVSSTGLVKIGKSDNVEKRRQALEQNINMFNIGKKITLRVAKSYPTYDKAYAFGLESLLHEYFLECSAGTSSKEVFRVPVEKVIEIAEIYARAFQIAQTIKLSDVLLREGRERGEEQSPL